MEFEFYSMQKQRDLAFLSSDSGLGVAMDNCKVYEGKGEGKGECEGCTNGLNKRDCEVIRFSAPFVSSLLPPPLPEHHSKRP